MAKKRGLGRGLDALLSGGATTLEPEKITIKKAPEPEPEIPIVTQQLPLKSIIKGHFQPRRHFDEDKLQELADSIQSQGLIQPIVVRPIEQNQYEIIAGERRWRAAQLIHLDEIPVVIYDINDQAAMAMGLVENIQRDDLNPLEEATALHRLLNEFGLTHQSLAKAVGKSRTTVTNLMRLLELTAEVKRDVEKGNLEMGHARALLALKEQQQITTAKEVIKQGLSVRETEQRIKVLLGRDEAMPTQPPHKKINPEVIQLQDSLTEKLGTPVHIQQNTKGKGRLVINYNSPDELDGILDHIN